MFDTSPSEEGIVGCAVGMALAGLMPCPEIQFRQYPIPPPNNRRRGHAALADGGRFACPMVLRTPALPARGRSVA